MQLFHCPWCGPRDQSEFTYGREAAPMPALDAPAADWYAYVYDRDNPSGPHAEWWHHNHGCRQWLKIVRDTMTHAVLSIEPARSTRGSNRGQTPIWTRDEGQSPISAPIEEQTPISTPYEGQTPISSAISSDPDRSDHER